MNKTALKQSQENPSESKTAQEPLRVIHVMAGAEDGGAEMAFIDMCLSMKEEGQDVHAICRPNNKRNPILEKAGIPVHEAPFGGIFDRKTPKIIAKIIEDIQPDVLQSWMSRAASKLPAKPKTDKPLLYVSRLGGYYNIKKYFKRTDIFVGATPDLKDHIVTSGAKEETVFQINNFAETEKDTAPVDRAELNTPEDAFVFLTLARLHKVKGLDTLLHAAQKAPKAFLWIAGAGPEEDALKKLCTSLGLDDRVRFLGWRTDRGALLSSCNAVAFPSRYEPFGSTFVQAWAAQRPLVTTASQGPSQYVRDEEDCLYVEIDDTDGLTHAMQRVIDDSALRDKIVKKGYERYLNEFERQKMTQEYLDLYRKHLNH